MQGFSKYEGILKNRCLLLDHTFLGTFFFLLNSKQTTKIERNVKIYPFFIPQNLIHPGVVNLEKMFETPERVSHKFDSMFFTVELLVKFTEATCLQTTLRICFLNF